MTLDTTLQLGVMPQAEYLVKGDSHRSCLAKVRGYWIDRLLDDFFFYQNIEVDIDNAQERERVAAVLFYVSATKYASDCRAWY